MATIRALLLAAYARVDKVDARVVLSHFTGKTKEFFIMHPEAEVPDEIAQKFLQSLDQIEAGCPVAYITGTRSFWGRDFHVTPAVLIPRPDTETLIETALAQCPAPESILDMGTGSGCIAISLALEFPQAPVLASDVSTSALEVARGNAQTLDATNVTFVVSDWFDAIENRTFDLIVSNPPYIEPDDAHLDNLMFEPIGALTDTVDGLSDLRVIIEQAPRHLSPGGILMVEHGYNQGAAVRELFYKAGFKNPATVKDLGDNDRITWARFSH
ncbi:MAG: peptide chain release factor N(5)-glutamine methyltransferase [Sutterellaceae bacterium]|nr:peptide chain release factor N(5)-glutamine methyltransferase [Sutterellaceae bacterium]